jgi:hypothetical protein
MITAGNNLGNCLCFRDRKVNDETRQALIFVFRSKQLLSEFLATV